MTIENSTQLVLFAAVIVTAAIVWWLGIWRGQPAHVRSRRLECYHRDLRKIDALEEDGALDRDGADRARSELLHSSIAGTETTPTAGFRIPNRRFFLVLLVVPAMAVFGLLSSHAAKKSPNGTGHDWAQAARSSADDTAEVRVEDDISRLESYVKTPRSGAGGFNFFKAAPTNNPRKYMSTPPTLPDVDTMIDRLAARLKNSSNDAEGWRMLGWSYFHKQQFQKSAEAYHRALLLQPNSATLKASLAEARTSASAPGTITPPNPGHPVIPTSPDAP